MSKCSTPWQAGVGAGAIVEPPTTPRLKLPMLLSNIMRQVAQVILIASYIVMCFVLIEFRGWGRYAFPPLYAALLIFYDTRRDIARRILPQLWQRKESSNEPATRTEYAQRFPASLST